MKGVSGATGAGEIFSRIVTTLEEPGGAPADVALKTDAGAYLEILSPLGGTRYFADPSLPKATQVTLPKFATGIEFDRSEWTLDGKPMPKEGIVVPNLAK